jgi:hypothetical protein
VAQLVEALCHKTGGPGFDFWWDQEIQSFCPHSADLGSTQPLTEMSTKGLP